MNKKGKLGIYIYLTQCLIAVLLTVINKKIVTTTNITVSEILLLRSFLVSLILFPFFLKEKAKKQRLKFIFERNNIIRGITTVLGTYMWYSSSKYMHINNVITLSFLTPICISIASALFFKKKFKIDLIIVSILSFIGVIIVINPKTENFHIAYLGILSVVLTRTLFNIFSQDSVNKKEPLASMTFATSIYTTMLFLPSLLSIKYMSLHTFLILLILSAVYLLYLILLPLAMKFTDIMYLQPFDFSRLVFSVILSYLLLGEKLDINIIIGSFVIISCNLYSFIKYEK